MGHIAQEILHLFQQSRSSDLVDFDDHIAAKKRTEAYQSHLNMVELRLSRGFDPLHAIYVSAQNMVALLCEELSMLSPLQPFVNLIKNAEALFQPDGPPFSPMTYSYFSYWAFFDVEFGPDRETMGLCILELGNDLQIETNKLDTIYLMQHSAMGIYEHCGIVENSKIILRDIMDNKKYCCCVPAGYQGETGQLWYVRLLPPMSGYSYSVVITTPYILESLKEEWLSFMNRTVPKIRAPNRPRSLAEAMYDLLKYGLNLNYWNQYICSAPMRMQDNVIFLAGIPDRLGNGPETSQK